MEDGLKIAVFGPADERERVIVTLLLVIVVVAARPVGTGDLERKLFLVEFRPAQAQTHHANQHDFATLPRHPRGLRDDVVIFGRSRNNDTIRARAPRHILHKSHRVVALGGITGFDALGAGDFQLGFVEIHAYHAAAVEPQQFGGQ